MEVKNISEGRWYFVLLLVFLHRNVEILSIGGEIESWKAQSHTKGHVDLGVAL